MVNYRIEELLKQMKQLDSEGKIVLHYIHPCDKNVQIPFEIKKDSLDYKELKDLIHNKLREDLRKFLEEEISSYEEGLKVLKQYRSLYV